MSACDCLQLICALTLALLCCNVNAVNLNNICLLLPNNQLIADTNSCSDYYLCSNGIAIAQSCQANFYFSKDQQTCIPASQSDCGSSSTDEPCKGYGVGTWAPVSGSCSGYYYCSASGPQRSNCPDGQNFNPTAQMCQYSSVYPCTETNPGGSDSGSNVSTVNLCSYIQNGIYYGSAGSCEGWNFCKNNLLTTGDCKDSLVFNVAIAKCDYPVNTKCGQVTHDPDLTGVSPSYGGSCSSYGAIKKAIACDQYYLCNGVSYNLQDCAGGQYFDTRTETCMNRINAYNNCDRCAGSKKSFVNAPSTTNCMGYLYCVDGVQQSQGTCNNGYFNEIAGACVEGDQPAFGCCNPNWAIPPGASTAAPGSTTSSEEATDTGSTQSGSTGSTQSGSTDSTQSGSTGTTESGSTGSTESGSTGSTQSDSTESTASDTTEESTTNTTTDTQLG